MKYGLKQIITTFSALLFLTIFSLIYKEIDFLSAIIGMFCYLTGVATSEFISFMMDLFKKK